MSFQSNIVPQNSMSSGNKQQNSSRTTLLLNKEGDRIKTFNSWTKQEIDKYRLAKFGFYHFGPDDAVKCVYCDVTIACWDIGDDALQEHINWSPSCPFLLHNAPVNEAIEPNFDAQLPSLEFVVPIVYNDDITSNQTENEPNRITQQIILTGEMAARHPAYRTQEKRLKSYENWPKSLKQKPQALSEAGLFYLGKGDQVKCFYCGGALRDFEDDDEPWIEHAKYFDCEFVKQCKGEQFIEQAKRTLDEYDDVHEEMEWESSASRGDDDEKIFRKCNICLAEELDTVFLPCMHIYTCGKCGFSFKNCPVCRQKITELKKCSFG